MSSSKTEVKVTEGYLPLHVPTAGKPCRTYYKIFGHLPSFSNATSPPPNASPTSPNDHTSPSPTSSSTHRPTPLIILHGGPGAPHSTTLALSDLTRTRGIPTIFYDQLGTGLSTHLPEKKGDAGFWTVRLFLDELANLITHLGITGSYDLYGHSWGGMLAASHAVLQLPGLRRLVLASAPASSALWTEAQWVLRAQLPPEIQETMRKCEEEGTTGGTVYRDAMEVFYARHLCRVRPLPDDIRAGFESVGTDPTVFETMNGDSEFYHRGSLSEWSIVSELHKINVLTLLTNGKWDQAADSVMEPFWRCLEMVRWERFEESSHMAHVEERERYMAVVGDFLTVGEPMKSVMGSRG
ncbi:hypothetical protein MMC30_004251 [Trapelia coarctata]|nr:hypothetical protein [Trapelia coarctata]